METDEGTGTTGGQEGGNTEGGEGDTGKTVPLSRLSEVIGQRDTARSRLAELEKQLAEQSPKLEQLTTLQTTLETERTEYARNQSAWEQTKALMRGGLVDDDAQEVAMLFYGKLPEDDRPDLSTWLGGFKEDPTSMPRALQPYLTSGTSTGGKTTDDTGDGGEGEKKGTVGRSKGKADHDGQAEKLTHTQIAAMKDRCMRSGKWQEWDDAKKAGLI